PSLAARRREPASPARAANPGHATGSGTRSPPRSCCARRSACRGCADRRASCPRCSRACARRRAPMRLPKAVPASAGPACRLPWLSYEPPVFLQSVDQLLESFHARGRFEIDPEVLRLGAHHIIKSRGKPWIEPAAGLEAQRGERLV